jgi:hypothetical protein
MSKQFRPKLSPLAVEIVQAASERLGISATAVTEYLIRRHGIRLDGPLDPQFLPPDFRGTRGKGRRKKSGKIFPAAIDTKDH